MRCRIYCTRFESVRGPLPEGRTQIENPLFRIVATRHQLSIEVKWNPECVTLVCRKYRLVPQALSRSPSGPAVPNCRSAHPLESLMCKYVSKFWLIWLQLWAWESRMVENELLVQMTNCSRIALPLWNPKIHHHMNYYLADQFQTGLHPHPCRLSKIQFNISFQRDAENVSASRQLFGSSEQNAIRMLLTLPRQKIPLSAIQHSHIVK
jgi:hypothetical protein